ncbi:hypothetical protein [Frankia sp. CiP3]|uniref:hypothetical protein n=1 Tax=Frankia sp. CiP3 TaxID=2880971 RepID=UPI001EF6D41D|nr:hypothetical protein [Frankia sp. CiP3]
MLAQPGLQGGGAAVGQHVHASVADGVDQQGCVPVVTPEREVVHAEYLRGRPGGDRQRHEQAQHSRR